MDFGQKFRNPGSTFLCWHKALHTTWHTSKLPKNHWFCLNEMSSTVSNFVKSRRLRYSPINVWFKSLPNSFICHTWGYRNRPEKKIDDSSAVGSVVYQVSCWHKKIAIGLFVVSARTGNKILLHFLFLWPIPSDKISMETKNWEESASIPWNQFIDVSKIAWTQLEMSKLSFIVVWSVALSKVLCYLYQQNSLLGQFLMK